MLARSLTLPLAPPMADKSKGGRPRKPVDPDSAGGRLAAWIDSQGLTREEFATQLAISRLYLDQICRGSGVPGRDLAVRIEEKTGIPVSAWKKPADK